MKNAQTEITNKSYDTKHNFVLFIPEIKLNDWKDENGKIVLTLKSNDPIKNFLAWMVKKNPVTDLYLDDRCSTVWNYMDGQRTIYDIAKLMSKKYKNDINNELYRLVTYLKYLSKRGWIKFKEHEA